MDTAGSKAQKDIPFLDLGTIDNLAFLSNPHSKTSQVVIVLAIHARHFSCFAANQASTRLNAALSHTSHYLFQFGWIIFPSCDIVQEVKGLSPCCDDVIDTHGYTVLADGIVLVVLDGQHELGPDTICSRNQDRLFDI